MAKTGRRPGETQTREQILAAARAQFAARGYDSATIRSIAQAADVHPALLHYHFRSKQRLYAEALGLPVDAWDFLGRLLDEVPCADLPEALVRHFVSTWRDSESGASLRAGSYQTFGRPEGSGVLRAHFESVLIPRMAVALGVPEVNVAAALSHLIGLVLADSVVGIAQLRRASEDELVELVGPVIRRYLAPGSNG